MKHHLEQLSGKDFDRAYITTLLVNARDMKAFEHHALVEKDQAVRQWAARAVPVVEKHTATAKIIASSLQLSLLNKSDVASSLIMSRVRRYCFDRSTM